MEGEDKTSYVFIGLGSNLGDKEDNINRAIELISGLASTNVEKTSSFYKTSPVGKIDQNWFVNAVIRIRTKIALHELMGSLIKIEESLGRVRKEKWGERVIDLDILFYDDVVSNKNGITVPHPYLAERRFVLEPLVEIAPDYVHPALNKSVKTLYEELKSDETVIRI